MVALTIVTAFAVAAADGSAGAAREVFGWDPIVQALLAVANRADVLALGEAHRRKLDSDVRLRLIRHPQFATTFQFVVLESAAVRDQPLIDRYSVDGAASDADAEPLWRTRPDMAALYRTIREMNVRLSPSQRVRVLAATEDFNARDRDAFAVSMIQQQVLNQGRKALVIYGSGHVWHREGSVTSQLDEIKPGCVFVVEIQAPVTTDGGSAEFKQHAAVLQRLEDAIQSTGRPVFVETAGSTAGKLLADPFYLGQAMLPPGTTLGDLDDAVIYFGKTPELGALLR